MPSDPAASLLAALQESYVIERELGGGGMSRVFLARDRTLDRHIVIKALPASAAGMDAERFRREILLSARLQHPHIVPVLAAGDAAGVPYFTMPFVAGESLDARLRDGARMEFAEVVRVLRDVASALAYAHAEGVVHRDIKPANVLLSGDGAMVTDFGVAKALSSAAAPGGSTADGTLTTVGTSLGTPAYMAPEQAAADPAADHRVDIYALGLVAYEMLAGTRAFAAKTPQALLAAQLTETPPPLATRRADVPPALAALIARCLEKDPVARPQRADDVVAALDDPALLASRARGATRRRWFFAAAAVLVIAAGTAGIALLRQRGAPAGGSPPSRSLAVLPFTHLGGDSSDVYLADGITDEVTTAMSSIPGLRVASRTSAFAVRGRSLTVREIGSALNVGAVLEGSMQRVGSRLRVTVQLTSTGDGLTLWSQRYDREMHDVFQMEDEIARAIVGALRLALAPRDTARAIGAQGTSDIAAYDLYLRGRYEWNQRGAQSLHRAARYFQQAIDRDARFARAYAGLSDALALLPIYGATPQDSVLAPARRAAERALALDSTLAEAHTTLALLLKSTANWDAAGREFQHAIALDRNYATAHQWYAELLLITGRVPHAVSELQQARTLDPLSPVINAELSYVLALAGRHAEGIATGRQAVELAPDLWVCHAFLAFAYSFAGRAAEAAAEMDTARRLDSTVTPLAGALAYVRAHAGARDAAREIVARIERDTTRENAASMALVMGYLGLGDNDRALAWLTRAANERDPWLYAMSVNAPWFDPIRADARFAAVVRTMGLDVDVLTRPVVPAR